MSFLPQTGCTKCNDCEANTEVAGAEQASNSEYYISDRVQLKVWPAALAGFVLRIRSTMAQTHKTTPPRGEGGQVFWFESKGNSEPPIFYLVQTTTSTEKCCASQCFYVKKLPPRQIICNGRKRGQLHSVIQMINNCMTGSEKYVHNSIKMRSWKSATITTKGIWPRYQKQLSISDYGHEETQPAMVSISKFN